MSVGRNCNIFYSFHAESSKASMHPTIATVTAAAIEYNTYTSDAMDAHDVVANILESKTSHPSKNNNYY